jgi:hypothetical protein
MPLVMSRLTREYVFVPIDTNDDLSLSTAQATFLVVGTLPTGTDWEPATLIPPDANDPSSTWLLRILVGPGHVDAVDLTPPTSESLDYQMWTAIDDNPERVVRRPGIVTVE